MTQSITHRIGFHAHCMDCEANLIPAIMQLPQRSLKDGDLLCELTTEHDGTSYFKPGDHNTSPRCK